MKKFMVFIVTSLVIVFNLAFSNRQTNPGELAAKWRLRANNSKLIGTIEIRPDGTYIYSVLPNYNQNGSITFNAGKEPKEIDLVAANGRTKGIYKITGNSLMLFLGDINGVRPANFNTGAVPNSILWMGTK